MPNPRAAILSDLKRAFPQRTLDAETFALYLRELDDVPADVLADVVRDHIRTATGAFDFPTIGALRHAVAERSLGVPSEAEALAQIDRQLRETRGGRPDAVSLHPVAREALRRVGGYSAFRSASEPGVLRGQFSRLYKELRAEAIRDAQTGGIQLVQSTTKQLTREQQT